MLTFTDANSGSFAYDGERDRADRRPSRGEVFGAHADLHVRRRAGPRAERPTTRTCGGPHRRGRNPGWGINLTQEGNVIFGTWFTYDFDGTPLWLSVTASNTAPGVYTGTLYRTTGPAFNAVPFDPAAVVRTPVGTATFTFSDGANAVFAYTVNGIAQTQGDHA